MSKLAEKLSRLLALATLREGEEADEGRQNEARNAAALLLKTCQAEGVRIKFVLPKQAAPAPPPPTPPVNKGPEPWQARYGRPEDVDFDDFVEWMKKKQASAHDARTSPFGTDGSVNSSRYGPNPWDYSGEVPRSKWAPPPPRHEDLYDESGRRRTRKEDDQYVRDVQEGKVDGRVEERFYTQEDPEDFFTRASVVRVLNKVERTCRGCSRPILPNVWMWTLLKRDGTYSQRFAHEACGHGAVQK